VGIAVRYSLPITGFWRLNRQTILVNSEVTKSVKKYECTMDQEL